MIFSTVLTTGRKVQETVENGQNPSERREIFNDYVGERTATTRPY